MRILNIVRSVLGSSLILALGLAGCAREVDNFNPQIVITQPLAGAILSNTKTIVKGYAYDDKGISKLVVGDKDLLSEPAFREQRGRKLVRFAFTAASLEPGRVAYQLRAVDSSGRSSEREIELISDTVKPKLEGVQLGGQVDTVSITGKASDNVKVARISVEGIPLNISSAPNVPFYAVVPRSRTITIVVTDSVGNTFQQDFRAPPAPPPPPPPPPAEVNQGDQQVQPTTTRRRRSRARTNTQVTQPARGTTGTTGTR